MLLIFFLFIWPIAEVFTFLECLFPFAYPGWPHLPLCIHLSVLARFAPYSLISSLDLYTQLHLESPGGTFSSNVQNETCHLPFHPAFSLLFLNCESDITIHPALQTRNLTAVLYSFLSISSHQLIIRCCWFFFFLNSFRSFSLISSPIVICLISITIIFYLDNDNSTQ